MPSKRYSKLVLDGVEKQGFLPDEIARITGLTASRIQKIMCEKASLTLAQLAAIEHATGMTGGQLAVRSGIVPDKRLSAVMDAWAEVRNESKEVQV